MKRFFTQPDIDKFLSDFKKLSNPYNIEKVHQLLNNPDARARYSVKLNHKPFNLFIMSAFILGLSIFLFFSVPKKINTPEISTSQKSEFLKQAVPDADLSPGKIADLNERVENPAGNSKIPSERKMSSPVYVDSGLHNKTSVSKLTNAENTATKTDFAPKPENNVSVLANLNSLAFNDEQCDWSPDTIIDKRLLLLELSDKELKAIGIARKGAATFYHNIIAGQYDWAITSYPDLIPDEERVTTFNKFFVAYTTNSQFEPAGPGNFYSSMDTLIPVITNNNAGQILWFTPHESFFNLLPERYGYLGNMYKNLICLKKKYPKRTFTNYLETGSESILDPVNVLSLNNEELQKIGVQVTDECITFQTRNKKYTLKICKTGTYSSGNDADFLVFPPNPYPVLMTDTLGRRLYVVNSFTNTDSLSKIMNVLIPVRIRLSQILPGNKEVIICWYYPTRDFLNSLPGKIGTEIRSELDNFAVDSKGTSLSCNYFEVCKSSLKLNNFKLYPNPASSFVTIEFENSEDIIGSISIVNMAGLKLRELLPNTTFVSGHNSYHINLSGITSGIYLISVNTKRGFRTQRLIISQ